MSDRLTEPVTSNAAWTRSSLDDDWTIELTPAQIDALKNTALDISKSGRAWSQTTQSDFDLPGWSELIENLRNTLEGGRGFARIRALPVSDISIDTARLMLWGIGQCLGYPEPQDASGNLLHDVRDTGKGLNADNIRAYQTNLPINYHNDGADAFMLLCYRAAASGGKSKLVSAVSVFNEILSRRSDLADILQQPFDFDARGQERPGAPPCQSVPIYTAHAGYLNVLYKREYIDLAQRFSDIPKLTPIQIEALDLMDKVCDELALEFVMKPGDIIVANNYDILHGRSAFDKAATDTEPRHMLRLWLSLPNGRPLPPIFEQTREFYHSYTRRHTQTESHT